jgi:uridine monophosphate synthetase
MNNLKNTTKKICLAADVSTSKELYEIIEKLGDHICILKLHHDIIVDFNEETIEKLNYYKKKYNLFIWEDRKFADIGHIMEKQVNKIKHWADIVSVHPIAGIESVKQIPSEMKIILIGELSSTNNLINTEYNEKVKEIAHSLDNCIGIVCQSKMTDTLLNIVPGISLSTTKDNKGQQYSTPNDRSFADIFVVGRSILNSSDPIQMCKNYSLVSTV